MHSLMAAVAPAAWSSDYVQTVVSLEGSPDGRYEISEEDGSVRVISATDSPAELAGPADHVLDSLSGRGPQLRELLSGPPAQREKLALLRAVALDAPVQPENTAATSPPASARHSRDGCRDG